MHDKSSTGSIHCKISMQGFFGQQWIWTLNCEKSQMEEIQHWDYWPSIIKVEF
jgi:hypothetical protein